MIDHSKNIVEIYRIPAPYSQGETQIVVYGEPDMGWYEWRVETIGKVMRDTKDKGYGCAEIALRDALVATSE
ncbi:MAG: hypothetical protein KGI52_12865 [Burkholderiales bacterium]|nr:hypothetical protein [Burkholderiales bacterium]